MTGYLSVILNEVKNRIVTKGKPTEEILHFVQNDIMGKAAFYYNNVTPSGFTIHYSLFTIHYKNYEENYFNAFCLLLDVDDV